MGSRVEYVLGVTEEQLVRQSPEERQRYVHIDEHGKQYFRNIRTQALTPIGSFTTPTVGELEDLVLAAAEKQTTNPTECQPTKGASRNDPCKFYCQYQVDIGELQTRLRTKDNCMVQIAGNFNCLNVASRRSKPNSGTMVERAHQQKTQGPAATFGAVASHLYRVHFCLPPSYSGQTLDQQVNLLDGVAAYTGRPINGKLTLTGHEQSIQDIDSVVRSIRVGLQRDCHILYGRDHQIVNGSPVVVDQCHGAAVNWNSLTDAEQTSRGTKRKTTAAAWTRTPAKQRDIMTLSRTVLRAAYEGVYLAALARKRKHLYLTLVGGGVFGNPNTLIVEELARAHQKWANHAASCLEGVYLCAFSRKDNVEHLLEAEGIAISPTRKSGMREF